MNANQLLDAIGQVQDQYVLSAVRSREPRPRRSLKKAVLLGLAATLILATMTGAAVYTRWSKSMDGQYQASEEQRAQAQDIGLSSMLEKEKQSGDILSVTDQGITVTAVQTIADNYHLKMVFRIEGLPYTEGMPPFAFPAEATMDGVPMHEAIEGGYGGSGWFYDGTVLNNDGKFVYEDGTPIQRKANGESILHYQAQDGSMEYILEYSFGKPGEHLGKVIEVGFDAFGHSVGRADIENDAQGKWRLRWKITGSEETYKVSLDAPLGDSGDVVKEIEITPLSIGAVVQTKNCYDSETALGDYPRGIAGLRMKDGTTMTLLGGSGSAGYQDEAKTLYQMRAGASRLYKVEDVEAVLFHNYIQDENAENGIYLMDENGHYLDNYIEIPIR
ncbi:MAG: DUF4179 domain-containing protein [Eubacteriales bacterium]|nr:DUF4179 domain-containing protein [Eubacteriales bacterium]